MSDPLVYARAVHFAATILAAGAVFFLVLIAEPALRSSGAQFAATLRTRLTWTVWLGLAVSIISGAAWFVLNAASMSGQPLAQVFADKVMATVLLQTVFGNDWLVRLVLAGLIAAAFAPSFAAQRIESAWFQAALAGLAAALAGSLAWAGHAIGAPGLERIFHPAADLVHLVAAAAWVGALVPLALLLAAAAHDEPSQPAARTAVLRFSTLGIASVATLLCTGIVNSWYLAGSVAALTGTDYGRLVLAKIALFFVMVAIAAVNRLRLTPRIVQPASPAVVQQALRQLRRNAAIEAALGALVIAVVAVLGTLPPASHVHQPAYGAIPPDAAFVHIHTEQGMADVTIEPGRIGTARATIRLWDADLNALDSREVTVTLTAPTAGSKPVTRTAVPDPDGSWQVEGIELSQPGNWTVVVSAALGPSRRLVLDAPIVIEAK